jgi:uncharacterized protein YceK
MGVAKTIQEALMKRLFAQIHLQPVKGQSSHNVTRVTPSTLIASVWLISLTIIVALSGCAHISFHDPANPKPNIGLEYYKPKLYLLVTQTKDGTKADVLTLPDLKNPRYALLHPGYGSSNLSLKLSNGILTDVGQNVDTKIPETITALSGLATAAAGAVKQPTKADGAVNEGPSFTLYEIIITGNQLKLRKVAIESEH